MYKPFFVAVIAALFVFVATAGAQSWTVGERMLPIPAGASAPVRAAISEGGKPNLQARAFTPTTIEQWRQLGAARAKAQAPDLAELGASLNVSITRDVIAGVPVHRVMPATLPKKNEERLFIYLHGGAYVFGGGDAAVREGALISSLARIPVISIDYRMPPDHPSPAAVEDVTAVYQQLLQTISPSTMGMGGTSAGGGLTLASILFLKSKKLPVPAALYLGTPWADLTKTSDTLYTNEGIDRTLGTYDGLLAAAAKIYAGDAQLDSPLISPVYGDFRGFPPAYLVSGTRDMLLSDTVRVHRKLRVAGVTADLNVYEGMSHAGYAMVPGSPEWKQVYGELVAFLDKHLVGQGSP